MIVRQLCARQGRRFLSERTSRISFRPLTTEVESARNPQSAEAASEQLASTSIPAVEPAPIQSVGVAESVENTFARIKDQQKTFNQLGGIAHKPYQPQTLLDNPPKPSDITLELLLASQSHLGHATSLWNSANAKYIFGVRDGIHIISLDITAAYLRRACKVVEGVARHGGLILFVGTKAGQQRCVVKAAELAQGYHIFERWTPGTLTNGQRILEGCAMQVVDYEDNPVPGYEKNLQNKPVLKPDLVVCLNPLENEVMLHECGLHNIPTIGIIDTNADPSWVTYPIPANDDSIRCAQVIAGALGRAGEEGQKQRMEMVREGIKPFQGINDSYLTRPYNS